MMKNLISIRHRRCGGPNRESGVALIIALICLFIMSTLAVGVLYSTQSEVWTNGNYRAMTQARYVAEAGAQQAVNYIQTVTPITNTDTSTTSPFPGSFNLNNMPVLYTNQALVMATSGIVGSQYADTLSGIDSNTDTAFHNNFSSLVTQTPFQGMAPGCSGSSCPQFNLAMQLLSASQDPTTGLWLTRWKIVSQGTVHSIGGSASTNSGNAMVQIVEVVDNVPVVTTNGGTGPAYAAAIVSTGTGCSVTMSGNMTTNSYNGAASGNTNNATPTLLNTGGDVITNGSISLSGGAEIDGNAETPFYNTGPTGSYGISSGSCSTSGTEYAVYESGGAGVGCNGTTCTQKSSPPPTPPPSYPTPTMPSVAANTASDNISQSATLTPSTTASLGAVSISGSSTVTLSTGTYIMDSFTISGSAQLVPPTTCCTVIYIMGTNSSNHSPINISGGSVSNSGGSPANLTFIYAGTQGITLSGGSNMFATVYAPNAAATISGKAGIYGAVVDATTNLSGGSYVAYDSALNGTHMNVSVPSTASAPGAIHVDEFSWSAF